MTVLAGARATGSGVVEGQVRIVVARGTAPADEPSTSRKDAPYADCPVVVLSKDGKSEIAQVPVDKEGRFHLTLPAGDYVLDVKRTARRRLLVTARPFTLVSGQTAHVDLQVESTVPAM